ncbi:uncharacterized protein [Pyxicephalus adspersus]|uniref:F-box only protein n=1 Tax=Pyxicephalus adspersus TaxID=30357 RepID=A0AAV3ARD6_PYXAD|nr:TPA: hypothetical protein GDO54_010853 [Pyxicephalus adspersus]
MAGNVRTLRYGMPFAHFLAPRPSHTWEPPQQAPQVNRERATCRGLVDMSDELLLHILNFLDAFTLLRAGVVCRTLYRISSTDSLWAKHCQATFGCGFRTGCGDCTPKEAFKLLYIWRTLYGTLPYNRPLQDIFFSGFPLKRYWAQLLTLEEMIPLPPIELPDHEIVDIWGIPQDLLDEKHKGDDELEWLYNQYNKMRFQWLFSYWLFGLSRSGAKQLQRIYLWWQRFDKRKVWQWGSANCDVKYFASLHGVTNDFWNGKLANGDENIGIQTVENYFSMCRSLLAWILGRKWGRFKQKKVYRDTLEGVYRVLKSEMQVAYIGHEHFWVTAKVQMHRVCNLEQHAGNYVNWKIIDALPCYRLFMATGENFYLQQIKNFLLRKQIVNNWIHHRDNLWVSSVLPESLFNLLEYDTKIYEDKLHGDSVGAHLSRLVWLFLHSGQQIFMDAMKGFVYQCAYASYINQMYENSSIPRVSFY